MEPYRRKYNEVRGDYEVVEAELKIVKQELLDHTHQDSRHEVRIKELERENASIKNTNELRNT